MRGIVKRLLVGLIAGLIIGLWVTAIAVSSYEAPVDPTHSLAEQESARERAALRFAATVFVVTFAFVAIPTYLVGNLKLPPAVRPVVLGALVGVVVVFAAAHLAAYARNEWPFRGKSPTTCLDWARTFGIPQGVVVGGTLGYLVSRRRANNESKAAHPRLTPSGSSRSISH